MIKRNTVATLTPVISQSVLVGMALFMVSCATKPTPTPTPPVAEKKPVELYQWNGDDVSGASSVVIYLDQQKAHFYKGGKKVGWTYVATGRASHPTPSGSFRILEKKADKVSNLYGKLRNADGDVVDSDFNTSKETILEGHTFDPAPMPMFMRLTNDGVGMHVGPIPNPGRPASHGCIRLPRYMAQKFFANTSIGTPVTIKQYGPESSEPEEDKKEEVKPAILPEKRPLFSAN
jgi:hypothetical protein